MSQELEQESEFISIENFITNWTEMVESLDTADVKGLDRVIVAKVKGLDYMEHKFCLVGEGYGNNANYAGIGTGHCIKCRDMALGPASAALTNGGETFKEFKKQLYDHMIESHPEKMRKY